MEIVGFQKQSHRLNVIADLDDTLASCHQSPFSLPYQIRISIFGAPNFMQRVLLCSEYNTCSDDWKANVRLAWRALHLRGEPSQGLLSHAYKLNLPGALLYALNVDIRCSYKARSANRRLYSRPSPLLTFRWTQAQGGRPGIHSAGGFMVREWYAGEMADEDAMCRW